MLSLLLQVLIQYLERIPLITVTSQIRETIGSTIFCRKIFLNIRFLSYNNLYIPRFTLIIRSDNRYFYQWVEDVSNWATFIPN